MASIFISREIEVAHWASIIDAGHKVEGKSLISFSPVYFDMPTTNWVFFYSQKGVKYFFEQSHGQLAPYRWAAMGPKTGDLLAEYVLDIDFVGTGEPHETARLFAAKVGVPETICFVRAKNSQQSIQKLMPKTASMEEVVVYANEKNDHVPSGPFDVLIFTSPLNAESFFSNRAWSGEKVIAIGSTTAGMLAELGIKDVYTPAIPTEESIIELLLSLI